MFSNLTFSNITGAAQDWLEVVQTPLAVLIGILIGLIVGSWILHQFGFGSSDDGSPGGYTPAGGSRGGRVRAPRSRQSASDREWAMLEDRARRVNGWDG